MQQPDPQQMPLEFWLTPSGVSRTNALTNGFNKATMILVFFGK
jgi:hypothetical protein